jgi:isoamyl acetate esterase
MTQILIFGDSITYGAWDKEGGWAQRLRKWLDEIVISSNYKEYFITYNLGIDGDTSEGLLKRFEQEAKPRIWPDEETIIIITIGANDCIFHNKTQKHKTDPEKYKTNLQDTFKLAKKYTKKIIFVGDSPIDGKKLDPIPWFSDYSFKPEHLETFMQIAKQACEENNAHFIDLQSKLGKGFEKLLVDGSHPNSEGHKKIFEIVKSNLIQLNYLNL